ncbi:hypothetical protein V8C34DRAFT_273998 [Trichoderma compactum]
MISPKLLGANKTWFLLFLDDCLAGLGTGTAPFSGVRTGNMTIVAMEKVARQLMAVRGRGEAERRCTTCCKLSSKFVRVLSPAFPSVKLFLYTYLEGVKYLLHPTVDHRVGALADCLYLPIDPSPVQWRHWRCDAPSKLVISFHCLAAMAPVDRKARFCTLSPSFLLALPFSRLLFSSSFCAVTSVVSSCYAGALVHPRTASTCMYSHQMIHDTPVSSSP